ncbi:MAG TPA: MdtA/MuxA family multidrug efflux RND transporter periplasmic adaptor subunit [Terriglobia bacterium]|nr:MdtA/MuxA family multidrug efflux RND transporter periplasmic adaptor subunit [Terriglobia bacterium]
MSEQNIPHLLDHETQVPKDSQGGPAEPKHRSWLWLLVIAVAIVAAGVYFFFFRSASKNSNAGSAPSTAGGAKSRGAGGAIPIVATKARKGDIGVYVTGLGAVTPIYTVSVRSRVDGELMKVSYKEGDVVHQGDTLVEIDPRPYQVQLEQAEGQLVKDQAALDNARVDLNRYQTLLKQNAIPEQQFATQQATVDQDVGAVKIDQANIDSAKLNLVYCHINAPITGRIGLRLVDPGNIVHSSDSNGLLVITQVQPISVIFTVAESQLPAVIAKMRAGQRLTVEADDPNGQKLSQGYLATIDNQIDPSTGTLRLRAIFDNKNNALFPNEFVNYRLLVEERKDVTLIPSAAVQRNTQSTYIWMVKPDSTVTVRQIGVGTQEGSDAEVTSGLSPGDTVVMTGVDKLQENGKIVVHFEGETDQGKTDNGPGKTSNAQEKPGHPQGKTK